MVYIFVHFEYISKLTLIIENVVLKLRCAINMK